MKPLAALVVGTIADLGSVRMALTVIVVVVLLVMTTCRPSKLSTP